jgi:hypothetical protein
MSLGDSVRAMFLVLCLGQLSAGCSSWDEDTPDHLDFALPTITWAISTDDPQWRKAPGSDVAAPGFVCSGPEALATDCCAPPFDCQKYPFACDPVTNFCALTFDVDITRTVELARVPAIAAVRGRVFARVALVDLGTSVLQSGDLPVRSANLFIGPQDLATPSDPSATLLAEVKLVPDQQTVSPDAPALQAFSSFASEYQNPFSLLLSLHVVADNRTNPVGEFHLAVSGHARAYY